MKKWIAMTLIFSMALSLVACSGKKDNTPHNSTPLTHTATVPIQEQETTPRLDLQPPAVTEKPNQETQPDSDPWNEDPDTFGLPITVINTLEENAGAYTCNIPEGSRVQEYGDYIIVKCKSGHLILLGLTDSTYAETESLEDAFDAIQSRIETQLDSSHSAIAKDHHVSISKQEISESQDTEMLYVRGNLSFVENRSTECNWTYICYVIPLSTGNYAYLLTACTSYTYVETKEISNNLILSFQEGTP